MKTDLLSRMTPLLPSSGRVLAAVSGGLDSMCLLHLLTAWQAQTGGVVLAAHFHHQLRGDFADRDEAFVRDFCAAHEIPFFAGRGDTAALAKTEGLTIEEAARRLRYAFLEKTAGANRCVCLCTAHHADDNAETMLLNLLRGTGSRGLSGIPPIRGQIRRPLLSVTRAELEAYAQEHDLPHVEDETNDEDIAARNLLRHKVLPVLKELNPRAVEHMSATAAILAREDSALDACAAGLTAEAEGTPDGCQIPCRALNSAPAALAERAVLQLMERTCGRRKDLTAAHVAVVLRLAAGERDGAVSLPHGLRVVRKGAMLRFRRAPKPAAEPVRLPEGDTRWGDWVLRCEKKVLQGVPKCPCVLLNCERIREELTVGAWRPGDGLCVGRGTRSLKRLFAERHIDPLRRDSLPVIYAGEQPAAIPALGLTDAAFAPEAGKPTWEITARLCAEYKEKGDIQ